MAKKKNKRKKENYNDFKIMFASDFHFPYQHGDAFDAFLDALKKEQPNVLVLGGDVVDFYKISDYVQYPHEGIPLEKEIVLTRLYLREIRECVGKECTIYWVEGNHESRLMKYLSKHAPELLTLPMLSIDEVFNLYDEKIDIIYVPSHVLLEIDDWVFRHGHEMGYGSIVPGNNARKGIYNYGMNYIQGHVHRGNVIHINQHNRIFTGVENPCLCDLNPKYVKGFSGWHLGWTLLVKKEGASKYKVFQTVLDEDDDIFW